MKRAFVLEPVRKRGQAPYILWWNRQQSSTSGSQSPFPDRLLLTLLAAAAQTVLAGAALAQDDPLDRVVLRSESGDGRITVVGRVIDYTGGGILIQMPGAGTERTYPTDQVISVETPQTESHQRGVERYRRDEIEAAESALETALNVEKRAWVRRDILALLVQAALRRGDHAAAGARFLALLRSDPSTHYFRLIPLSWTAAEPDPAAVATARNWNAHPVDAARLMAASVLLTDPRYGEQAAADLRELRTSRDPRVGALARAQLWRSRLHAGDLNPHEIDRWERDIETMPEDLRGGPYYVLGQARRLRREHDRAAAALLWIPLVYADDHHLAARACLEAADALAAMGRKAEATTLYREVAERFRGTPFANEAASLARPARDEITGP